MAFRRIERFDVNTASRNEVAKALERDGVCVFVNAVPDDLCERFTASCRNFYIDVSTAFLNDIKEGNGSFKRYMGNRSPYTLPTSEQADRRDFGHNGLFNESLGAAVLIPETWEIRHHVAENVFGKLIYNCPKEELVPSIDNVCYDPGYYPVPQSGVSGSAKFHIDQRIDLRDEEPGDEFVSYQGLVFTAENKIEDENNNNNDEEKYHKYNRWGTTVLPGSHTVVSKLYRASVKKLKKDEDLPNNFSSQIVSYARNELAPTPKKEDMYGARVMPEKGSMLVWDSRVIHKSNIIKQEAERCAFYVTFEERRYLEEKDVKHLKECVELARGNGHSIKMRSCRKRPRSAPFQKAKKICELVKKRKEELKKRKEEEGRRDVYYFL